MKIRIKGNFTIEGLKLPHTNFDRPFQSMELEILETQPYRVLQFSQKRVEKKAMKTDDETIMEIYRRMFKEAEPSADFDKILKSGEGKRPNFFMKYYLDQDRQDEIVEEVCIEHKVKKWMFQAFRNEVTLGSSPTGNKEAMLRATGLKK